MMLTAAAHALAGGELPSLRWLASMSAGVLVLSLAVLRGAIRVRTAVPAIGLLQVALHLTFQATAAHGHAEHGTGQDLALSLPMLFAHLVTTAAAAALLVIQERAIVRACDWLDGWRRPHPLLPAPRIPPMPSMGSARRVARRVLLLQAPRRGPPAITLVAPDLR